MVIIVIVMMMLTVVVMMMIVLVMFIVVVMLTVFLVLEFIAVMLLYLLYPCSGGCYGVKVEHACAENLVEVYVAIVARDNLRFRLDGTYYLLDTLQFLWSHLGSLVEEDDITELNLLDNEVLDVLLVALGSEKRLSAAELVLHAQGIHHGNDAVELWRAALVVLRSHGRYAADGLGYWSRLADTACLNDYIVELL